ncbi:RNase P/MRP p29 subunit, partial [Panus rudis PR-1116 ss-1]
DIYTDLPPINNQRIKLNSSTPFTPTFVKDNITRSSDSSQIYASRVQGRQLLLDNPPRESKTRQQREERKRQRIASNARSDSSVIGRKEAQEKGLWKLSKSEAKFERFLPLHYLWLGYVSELLNLAPFPGEYDVNKCHEEIPSVPTMQAKIVKADIHGSIITVRQSKNPCLVGLSGIVIHETENSFKVVTKNDRLKLIPKANSIFGFPVPLYAIGSANADPSALPSETESSPLPSPPHSTVLNVPHVEFELYGNQFCFRSADRANRKFKHKESISL